MVLCRIGYLLALAAAGAFFICFSEYFSFYILVLALVFPLLSLLVSLPGMLGLRAGLAAPEGAVRRHGTVFAELRLTSRWRLPVSRAVVWFHCRNLMTGDVLRFHKRASGATLGLLLPEELESKHCGRVTCAVEKLKVYDLLGLFSIRLNVPEPVSVLILPLELESERTPTLLGAEERNVRLKPRPGGGPGEDYDLRPYRPGDPMRSVHWKLSSKMDDLVVRETLEPVKTAVVLSYDHFGAPDTLDAVLDRLDAVSRGLIEREVPHYIQWADPAGGEVHSHYVNSLRDLRSFQWEAFSTPAPLEGQSVLAAEIRVEGIDGPLRHLHVIPHDDEGGGAG